MQQAAICRHRGQQQAELHRDLAFRNCSALELLDLSSTQLASFGANSAFQGRTSLKDIKLPDTLTIVGDHVFNGMSALESVCLPAGVTAVPEDAFQLCSALKTVYVPATLNSFAAQQNLGNSNKGVELVVYGGDKAPECLGGSGDVTSAFQIDGKDQTVTVPGALAAKINALNVTEDTYQTADVEGLSSELAGLSNAAKSVLDNPELLEAKLAVAAAQVDMYTAKAEASAKEATENTLVAVRASYGSTKSVDENVQAAKNAVDEAQKAAAEAEQAVKDACAAAGVDYDGAKSVADNIASVKQAASAEVKASEMIVKANSVKAKAKKNTTVNAAKAFTVKGANGKVSYYKVSGDAKIAVSKTGKVTVKKGLKAKSYKVKVLVCDEGSAQYAPATKTVTLKVKVTK